MTFEWSDRTQPTPKGKWIWVSDGKAVWLLKGDGCVFSEVATACKFWTEAVIPPLPNGEPGVVEGEG